MRRSVSDSSLGVPTPGVANPASRLLDCVRRRRRLSPPVSNGWRTPVVGSFGDYVRAEMQREGRPSFAWEAGDAMMVLPSPRRNLKLAYLRIDTHGNCDRQVATRHEILNHVRSNWAAGEATDRVGNRRPANTDDRIDLVTAAAGAGSRAMRRMLSRADMDRGKKPGRRARERVGGNRLTVRDMRQIDPAFTATPAIWVREDAIVVSLEGVRAIILHNYMFVFDADNESMQAPIWSIRKRLMSSRDVFMPFEFVALEGVLIHACWMLGSEFFKIEPELRSTLGKLPKSINNDQLERLRVLELRLNHYYARAKKVQSALQSVLDEDEDMADMYLTEKMRNPGVERNPVDHDEAEMLLETYLQSVDDLTSKAGLLNRAIDDTENLIEIHLDTMQNRLLLVDLLITAITTTLSFGTMITSIFGMNFPLPDAVSTLPASKFYFLGCIIVMLSVMSIGLVILVRWCRRQGIYSGRPSVRRKAQVGVAMRASVEAKRQAEEVLNKPRSTEGWDKEWGALPE